MLKKCGLLKSGTNMQYQRDLLTYLLKSPRQDISQLNVRIEDAKRNYSTLNQELPNEDQLSLEDFTVPFAVGKD